MGGTVAVCVLLLLGIFVPEIQAEAETDAEMVKRLNSSLTQLARQMMLHKLSEEETIRANGASGIKITRLEAKGLRPYDADTHTSKRKICAAHNHDNNIRTVGLGEFVAVLNGVEFRTRHNDYRLYRPSTTSSEYHKTEDVPFPDVPPAVLEKTTVEEQVAEMKEWFRAFKDQNETHRDFTPYFKPTLCYLEGFWSSSVQSLEEPFESDRHFVDAASWYDLHEKIRFTSYNGGKSTLENFAYLPTTIMEMINNTIPRLAQWNYRILCHPLKNYLYTDRFVLTDDLTVRMREAMDWYEYKTSRAARFQLNPQDSGELSTWNPQHQFLDTLMEEIPGKDNYPGNLTDESEGALAYPIDGGNVPLNVAYYHRIYKVNKKDAMGLSNRVRGFHDPNLFAAATTQPQVAPMKATFCEGWGNNQVCEDKVARWTYAIPLEIIYLTPLSSWNPYNLTYKGDAKSDAGKEVTADGRDGTNSTEKAYNGLNSKIYYMTPADFYNKEEDKNKDPADTSTDALFVNDPNGIPRAVASSGVRINMQYISEVGLIRQRYPIMPLFSEGDPVLQELEALKDIVLEPAKYQHMLRGAHVRNPEEGMTLKMKASSAATGAHDHFVELTGLEVERLYKGDTVEKVTSSAGSGHEHTLRIVQRKDSTQEIYYKYLTCDTLTKCGDNHPTRLIIA